MSVLKIEIRHKLPLWRAFTSWSHTAKAGTKRRWREHVEKALMHEHVILSVNPDNKFYWRGEPFKVKSLKYVQLVGVNLKTKREGNEYDRDNLISLTGKLVIDNLVHIGLIADDTPKLIPTPETDYEHTRKPWHGVRVELEY